MFRGTSLAAFVGSLFLRLDNVDDVENDQNNDRQQSHQQHHNAHVLRSLRLGNFHRSTSRFDVCNQHTRVYTRSLQPTHTPATSTHHLQANGFLEPPSCSIQNHRIKAARMPETIYVKTCSLYYGFVFLKIKLSCLSDIFPSIVSCSLCFGCESWQLNVIITPIFFIFVKLRFLRARASTGRYC